MFKKLFGKPKSSATEVKPHGKTDAMTTIERLNDVSRKLLSLKERERDRERQTFASFPSFFFFYNFSRRKILILFLCFFVFLFEN